MSETRPLRVALVGPQAPPAGGMAAQRGVLMSGLSALGVEVLPVVVNPPYRPHWVGRVRGVRALARLPGYVAALWQAAGRADVMHVMANSGWAWHVFAAPAVWVAHARGVPVVMSYHGGLAHEFLQSQGRWVQPTLARVRQLTTPSGFLQGVFAHFGVPAQVVPNAVQLDAHAFRPRRPGGAHIVVTRNLEPIYGLPCALRAFARVCAKRPDARLTLAGSGPLLESLRRTAQALGVAERVRFAGRLNATQIAALYETADVMLNPSLADNSPNSVLEAMACGLPVVSTRVGGVPWLIDDARTGWLVDADDEAAMAHALLRVLDHPAEAATLAHAAFEQVRAHDVDRVCAQWVALYRAVHFRGARPRSWA